MDKWVPYLLVGVGGFLGSNVRYLAARWIGAAVGGRFPLGTFVINVTGSFLLGLVGWLVTQRLTIHGETVRLLLGVGFLGGYTTFSTFEYETHALLEDGAWLIATANVVLSVFLGLVAVRLGTLAGRAWLG